METISTQTSTLYEMRPIRPEDNPRVAQIIRQVMTEFGCVGPGYSIEDPEVDDMAGAYNDERSVFYVIDGPEGVAGCGGIAPLAGGDGSVCELKKMYFLPVLRGRGWGRRLMQQCLDAARERGFRYCYLETVERMATANQLYRSFGFERLSGPEGATGHCGCDFFYQLEL